MDNFAGANISGDEVWGITGEWLEGMVKVMKVGARFHVADSSEINRNQYFGDPCRLTSGTRT